MSVRVRFAPSPTGHLHVGGARTALYNFLYARAQKGTYVVRVEDTDQERSEKEFENSQIADLAWLGIIHDEGPDKDGGKGPYRQSERLETYREHAQKLLDKKEAFKCFCGEKELEQMREKAQAEGKDPHYDGRCRKLSEQDIEEKIKNGGDYCVRYHVQQRDVTFNDLVRGDVTFPANMVGDFVILRTGGYPVYNFCCVIDDMLMEMTHVIRAEDHLSNTLRQIMIYEAYGATPPKFGHVSLLVGEDRQKLSKRHAATSVTQYRDMGFLPEAMVNYLVQLGWSHPEEKDVYDLDELISCFSVDRFSKSPAVFDLQKLRFINSQHMRNLDEEKIVELATPFIKDEKFHSQSAIWKQTCLGLLKNQVEVFSDLDEMLKYVFSDKVEMNDEIKEIFSWETTPSILSYVKEQIANLLKEGKEYLSTEDVGEWMNVLKKEHKIKGKPLFMGLRGVLTGQGHGPDLKVLLTLTPLQVIAKRLESYE